MPESGQDQPLAAGLKVAWKFVERTCVAVGAAGSAAGAYFAYRVAFPPSQPPPAHVAGIPTASAIHAVPSVILPSPEALHVYLALSGALIITGVAMMFLRQKAARPQLVKAAPESQAHSTPASPPPELEALDITEAKSRLCSFVMDTLAPAITSCRDTLNYASWVIHFSERGRPFVDFTSAPRRVLSSRLLTQL